MSTIKITVEDAGVTKTYEKDFGDGWPISVEDFFEACLESYDSNGYCNTIDVNVCGISGNVTKTISWDKDNYILVEDKMTPVDDIASYLQQGQPEERWYMGHKY